MSEPIKCVVEGCDYVSLTMAEHIKHVSKEHQTPHSGDNKPLKNVDNPKSNVNENSGDWLKAQLAEILKTYKTLLLWADAIEPLRTNEIMKFEVETLEKLNQVILSKHKLEVLEGRYDELEKARWIIQKHNPKNTLAGVYIALNHRSAELENERSKIEGVK